MSTKSPWEKVALEAVGEGTRNQNIGWKKLDTLSISPALHKSLSSGTGFDLPFRTDTKGKAEDRREVKSTSNNPWFSQAKARNDEREKGISFDQRLERESSIGGNELPTTPESSQQRGLGNAK
ncbi:hypothetical protein V6N13_017902 [Hibiscus sabdariffa]